MVDKVQEYTRKKSELPRGETLVEAGDDTARSLQMELETIARAYKLSPGEDPTRFPELDFGEEPQLEMPPMAMDYARPEHNFDLDVSQAKPFQDENNDADLDSSSSPYDQPDNPTKQPDPGWPPEMAPSVSEMAEEWRKDPSDLPEGTDVEAPCTDTDPHRESLEEQVEGAVDKDKVKTKEDNFVP